MSKKKMLLTIITSLMIIFIITGCNQKDVNKSTGKNTIVETENSIGKDQEKTIAEIMEKSNGEWKFETDRIYPFINVDSNNKTIEYGKKIFQLENMSIGNKKELLCDGVLGSKEILKLEIIPEDNELMVRILDKRNSDETELKSYVAKRIIPNEEEELNKLLTKLNGSWNVVEDENLSSISLNPTTGIFFLDDFECNMRDIELLDKNTISFTASGEAQHEYDIKMKYLSINEIEMEYGFKHGDLLSKKEFLAEYEGAKESDYNDYVKMYSSKKVKGTRERDFEDKKVENPSNIQEMVTADWLLEDGYPYISVYMDESFVHYAREYYEIKDVKVIDEERISFKGKGETTSYDIDIEITVLDNNTALFKITNHYDNSTGVYSAEKF